MTTFNTTRNETKNYKEIILPPYLKPSQLWIAVPRLEYCDRNDNYSSTRQEKQFAGSPIFVSTFQGGLPRIDQVSPAAPPPWTTALLNTPFPQNTPASAMPQGHPGSASASSFWLGVWSLQPSSMASQTRPVLQTPLPTGIPTSQGAGCSEHWDSQTAGPQRLQEHSCAPDSATDVVFPSLAEPALHLQQSLAVNTFSAWLKPNTKRPEKLKSFSAFVLKCSTLLIKLGETHQNPKSKGMLCSFWQIIIISFIYKNQTAPKPQLHTRKKLKVVSKDYRN